MMLKQLSSRKILYYLAVTVLVFSVFSSSGTFSAEAAGPSLTKTKPTVVIIRAQWCHVCQKLEPTMMDLMKEYGEKLDFVILDVTNDETTSAAAEKAKSLGISSFFEANKKVTSTVAIFKGTKLVFKTAMNTRKEDFVKAFEKVIE